MNQRRTLYDDLGINATASPGRIKAAFDEKIASLAKEDGPLAAREREALKRAYETLSDADRRDQYNNLMGLPAYVPAAVRAQAAKAGAPVPIWLVLGGLAILGLCALPFVWKPKRDLPVAIDTPAPSAASTAGADPTAPVVRPIEPAKTADEQARYDEKVRREFDQARRSYEHQKRSDEHAVQQYERTEKYKAETEKRKAEYEEQREKYRAQQEKRELEMRQRAEVERVKQQLRELQQR